MQPLEPSGCTFCYRRSCHGSLGGFSRRLHTHATLILSISRPVSLLQYLSRVMMWSLVRLLVAMVDGGVTQTITADLGHTIR